jgi:hypothetical protein
LQPRLLATLQGSTADSGQAQPLSDQLDQRRIGPTIGSRRRDADLDRVTVHAGKFISLCSRLDVDAQGERRARFA